MIYLPFKIGSFPLLEDSLQPRHILYTSSPLVSFWINLCKAFEKPLASRFCSATLHVCPTIFAARKEVSKA